MCLVKKSYFVISFQMFQHKHFRTPFQHKQFRTPSSNALQHGQSYEIRLLRNVQPATDNVTHGRLQSSRERA